MRRNEETPFDRVPLPCTSCGAIEGQGCVAPCEAVSRGFRDVDEHEYRRVKRDVLRHEYAALVDVPVDTSASDAEAADDTRPTS